MHERDFSKPLYADYKRQALSCLIDDRLIHSDERVFEFADRTLILLVYFELFATLLFIYLYLPKPGVCGIFLYPALIVLGFLCTKLYRRWFVYRYARFRVRWEDWSRPGTACEGCDEQGKFLPSKENRHAAVKSRLMFIILLLAVAAVAVMFYTFTWGMAEQRLKDSWQLEEFARIAEKQGDVVVEADWGGVEVWPSDGESFKEIAREDEKELEGIFGELQWNYVESLYWMDGEVHVFMHGGFEPTKVFNVDFGLQ